MPAIAIGVGAAIGGVATAIGASSAAKAQQRAAAQATAVQQAQYNQTRSDFAPYQQAGQAATNQLTQRLGDLTSPFSMTQENLEATPGYQFNLSQGLKSVNNAMGARGLLNSGAVMKGASQYATGLANSTYLDQFNMDQANKLNAYNKLIGVADLGSNAANNVANYGQQTAHDIAGNYIGAGNARAAGDMGIANGFSQVANGIATTFMPNSWFNPLSHLSGYGVPQQNQTATGAYYGSGR